MALGRNGFVAKDRIVGCMWSDQEKFNAGAIIRKGRFINMDKLTTALSLIQEFLPLMEKYDAALLKISKDSNCPDNLCKIANAAIDFGREVVDEEECLEDVEP